MCEAWDAHCLRDPRKPIRVPSVTGISIFHESVLTLLWEIEPNFRYLCYKSEPSGNSPHGWFTSKDLAEMALKHAVLPEIQDDGTAAMDEMETC